MLKALGYKGISEESYFDASTVKAVKEFQKKNNLTVDGKITGETTIIIMEHIQKKLKENDTQLKKAISVLKEKM
jgi:carboxyl-terminal processing protease